MPPPPQNRSPGGHAPASRSRLHQSQQLSAAPVPECVREATKHTDLATTRLTALCVRLTCWARTQGGRSTKLTPRDAVGTHNIADYFAQRAPNQVRRGGGGRFPFTRGLP